VNQGIRRALVWAAMAMALSAAQAGTGYRSDYDYPDQGDDWYGRSYPDPSRDYPPATTDLATDGDDYGVGYDRLTDRFGYGPPVEFTNLRHSAYVLRFGSAPFTPPECFLDAECDDAVFCDGVETCLNASVCANGVPPTCDDGQVCTIDRCDPARDACLHDPYPAAPEIDDVRLSKPDPFEPVALLDWQPWTAADGYTVYRGEGVDWPGLECLVTDVPAPGVQDDGGTAPSGLYLFLVTASGCGFESPLGDGRPPSPGCSLP